MDSSMIQALIILFLKQVDGDLTFNVKEQDIKAHTSVLNLRSEVLKTMINNELSYENGKIVIKDPEVGAEDFKEFLKFLYIRGHMYLVPSLLEKCATFIQYDLYTCDNMGFFEYAELGLLYENDCSLIDRCLKHISTNSFLLHILGEAKASAEFVLKMVKDCTRTDSCTEDLLFKSVLKWAEYQCCQNEIDKTSENLKAVMKDMVPFIKFDQLKPITLATIVAKHNLLSDKEILDAICKSVVQETKSPSVQNFASNIYN